MNWGDFILVEKASKDTIDVKRIYIDMAGDLAAGVLLSQLVFYHLPTDKKSHLWVRRAGKWWLALQREGCWKICRLTPEQFDRSLDILSGKFAEKVDMRRKEQRSYPKIPLIEVELHISKSGAPCPHIRLIRENFLSVFEQEATLQAQATTNDSEGDAIFSPDIDEASISTKPSNATGEGDSAGQAFEGNAEKHLREMPKSDLGNTPKSHLREMPKSIYKKQEVKKVVEDIYTPDAPTSKAKSLAAETESVIAPYREAFLVAYGVLAGDMPKKDLAEMAEPILVFRGFASGPGPQDMALCAAWHKASWEAEGFNPNSALIALRLVVKGYATWNRKRPGPESVQARAQSLQPGRPARPQPMDRRAGDARHYGGTPEDAARIEAERKANAAHEYDWLKEMQAQGAIT